MNKHRATREPIEWNRWRIYPIRTVALALIHFTRTTKQKQNTKKHNRKK